MNTTIYICDCGTMTKDNGYCPDCGDKLYLMGEEEYKEVFGNNKEEKLAVYENGYTESGQTYQSTVRLETEFKVWGYR